jgi:hypothetical protein
MKAGDLCRSHSVTALYATHEVENHDRHGVVNSSELLMYLGESRGDYHKVASVSRGKSGWVFRKYLSVL